jgi:hypothetical protein
MRLLTLIAAVLLATLSLSATRETAQAQEQSYTFRMKSNYKYIVQIAFFSQDRPNMEWPGSGKAWALDDSKVHDIPGAWAVRRFAMALGRRQRQTALGAPNGRAGCKRCLRPAQAINRIVICD